jgi:hypothetical protein
VTFWFNLTGGWKLYIGKISLWKSSSEMELMFLSSYCPLCNGMQSVEHSCSNCGNLMIDYGRVMDFDGWDPYSPYLPIDTMKQFNGIQDDYKNHQCPHVYACEHCGHFLQQLVDEISI